MDFKINRQRSRKSYQVEGGKKPGSAGYGKRFRQCILMKFLTFKCLHRYIQSCIDTQFEYLTAISHRVSVLARDVYESIENKTIMFKSSIVDKVNIGHVSYYIDEVSTDMLESL